MLDAQMFLPPHSSQLREHCNHEYHDKLPAKARRKELTNRTTKKLLFLTKIVHLQTSAHESTVIGLSYVMVMMEGLIDCTLLTVGYTRNSAVQTTCDVYTNYVLFL